MSALATAAANTPWIEPSEMATPREYVVKVKLADQRRFEYRWQCRSTMEAYDLALDKHPQADRIDVKLARTEGGSDAPQA